MANDFKIRISAEDRATATIRKINDSMSKMTRPFDDAKRSMVGIGAELKRNPAVKALVKVEQAAEGVAFSLAKVAGPMLGITGIGVVAGISELATQWGRLGLEVKSTSSKLGMSTYDLQSMRGAAKLAGVSAEDMTGALGGLGSALFDAKSGANPLLNGWMKDLKVDFHEAADGGYDLIAVMKDIARAMAAQKTVGAKHRIAHAFQVESSYAFLDLGPDAIEKHRKEFEKLAGIPSNGAIDQADEFAKSLNRLSAAAEGVKNSLGDKIIPVVKPLVDDLTDVLSSKKEKIGNGAAQAADIVGKHGLDVLPQPIKAAANLWGWLLGGRQGSQSASGKITYPDAPTTAKKLPYNAPELNAYASSVEERLHLPKNILNSIKNFGERSNSDQTSPAGAKGVMQFMPKTWDKYGKGDITNPTDSIDAAGRYFQDMLKRYDGNVDAAITEYNGGPKQAKAVQNGGAPWRAETASYLPRVKAGMAAMDGGGNGSQGTTVQHDMTITLNGLPRGVTATAKSATGADVPVRIYRAMPTLEPI